MYKANSERYDRMQYIRCGESGLLLPRLALGLWQNFGAQQDFNKAKNMVCGAFDLGITYFDLANNYGPPPGGAEETFGRIIKEDLATYRDEMIIATKAGYTMWDGPYGVGGSKKYLISSLDQSLRRMGLDYVDIFYSHRYDENTPLEETMDALATIVRQGKALYVGISNYKPEQTKKAYKILHQMGVRCLIHQPSYSMLNRWIEEELLDVLEERGMGCAVFSPLAQGLLSTKYLNGIPSNSRAGKQQTRLHGQITEETIAQIRQLGEIAEERGQSLPQMALAWVLRENRVQTAIIGASSMLQIEENVDALQNLYFTRSEIVQINDILNQG